MVYTKYKPYYIIHINKHRVINIFYIAIYTTQSVVYTILYTIVNRIDDIIHLYE